MPRSRLTAQERFERAMREMGAAESAWRDSIKSGSGVGGLKRTRLLHKLWRADARLRRLAAEVAVDAVNAVPGSFLDKAIREAFQPKRRKKGE